MYFRNYLIKYDALEPYIDAATMEIHHSKHHAAYVNGLNAAEAALAKARIRRFCSCPVLTKRRF